MHTPGHNPYLTDSYGDFGWNVDFDDLTNYSGVDYNALFYNLGISDPEMQQLFYDQYPELFVQTLADAGLSPGLFSYQGISPEIMGAIGNVFSEHVPEYDTLAALEDMYSGEGGGPGWSDFEEIFYQNLAEGGFESEMIDTDGDGVVDTWDTGGGDQYGSPWQYGFGTGDVWGQFGSQGGEGIMGVNVFDPESLAAGLSAMTGHDDSIRAGEVRALTPEMIEKTTSAYYNPYETAGREELIEKRGKALGRATTGGFAGSGSRQAGLSGAERLYRGGYQDLISDILKMRGDAPGNVMDTIYGWQELMSGVTDE